MRLPALRAPSLHSVFEQARFSETTSKGIAFVEMKYRRVSALLRWGALFANQAVVCFQQIIERINSTHDLNAGQIRCQDAAERLNHLPEIRQQSAFFLGKPRQF